MALPILMPALSPTMTEGMLSKWLKKEGDKVDAGDIIAEVETDKATMEVEAADSGKLAKILVPEGHGSIPVNQLIAVLIEEGESESAIESVIVAHRSTDGGAQLVDASSPPAEKYALQDQNNNSIKSNTRENTPEFRRIFASPLAKKIAKQQGLDIAVIGKGSGPGGRIVKKDVLAYIADDSKNILCYQTHPDTTSRKTSLYSTSVASSMRKVIAKRLVESKQQVPHFYLQISCVIDALLDLRENINIAGAEASPVYKISVNDIVVKAVSKALAESPGINVSWQDDGNKLVQYSSVDLSIAVATDKGLITPIVFGANQKGLIEISNEIKSLAKRARDGKLKPEEFQGGCFSISNLGMYGIDSFQAIINPPQACILAIGAGLKKPVIQQDKIVPATVMQVNLSCDHRVVDGAVAAQFLNKVKYLIENPLLILV